MPEVSNDLNWMFDDLVPKGGYLTWLIIKLKKFSHMIILIVFSILVGNLWFHMLDATVDTIDNSKLRLIILTSNKS